MNLTQAPERYKEFYYKVGEDSQVHIYRECKGIYRNAPTIELVAKLNEEGYIEICGDYALSFNVIRLLVDFVEENEDALRSLVEK